MYVSPSGGGTVEVNGSAAAGYPSTYTYSNKTTVYLRAIPESGKEFNGWSGALTGTQNPDTLYVDCVQTITANFSGETVDAHTEVTVEEAKKLIDSNNELIILDVREESEYCNEIGHIPGALNYPLKSEVLQDRYDELPLNSDILVVCRSGVRSHYAASFLSDKGFTSIFDMNGGMLAWESETESCDEIYPLYYPHVISDKDWETEICLINTSSTRSLNGVFRAYNEAGEEVESIPAGEIGPYARREFDVSKTFFYAHNIAYIIFEADSDEAVGYAKFYIEGGYRAAIPAVKDVNAGDIFVPHIASTQRWWTGIVLLNTTATPRELIMEFDSGENRLISLAGNEYKFFTISSLFGENPKPDIHSAVIKDGSGVVGVELFGCTGNANQLSAVLLKALTSDKIYFPHFVETNKWWMGIVVYNTEASSCTLTVKPNDAQGMALMTPRSLVVGGHGKYIGTGATLNLPTDTDWLEIEGTKAITGLVLFGASDGNQLAGYTTVGSGGKAGYFAKLEKNGWTGIAFVNTEDSAATVTLAAHDDLGNLIAETLINMDAHAKEVGIAERFFQQDIRNATYLRYSSDRDIVGFQLNGSNDDKMLDGLPTM